MTNMPMDEIAVRPARRADDPVEIARLIGLTDPYIYPAAFGEDGVPALADMVSRDEGVFSWRGILVAEDGGRLMGQAVVLDRPDVPEYDVDDCLWRWPMLPASFRNAMERYVNGLNRYVPANGAYIPCVSVAPRARGQGVGGRLLEAVTARYGHRWLRLHVLAENAAAIRLYRACGFTVVGGPEPGYAWDGPPPMCLEMVRMPDLRG